MNINNGISVIICTYNGARRLPETLKHLACQDIPEGFLWEIIIVDNNSSDYTSTVAKEEWAKYSLNVPFTVVLEPVQGLSAAKKKGAEVAVNNIFIFCDDDNWLQRDFVRYAYEIMTAHKNIGVLGGRSSGYFETEKPFWFDNFQLAYVIGNTLEKSGSANERKYLAGAAMVVRKAIFETLERLSFRSLLSGRNGQSISSGEDSELCLLSIFLGYDLYYDDRLQFTHYITAGRLKWKYCVDMISKGFAYPQIYFAMYDYCYSCQINGKEASFENIIRWNRRKLLRSILNDCRGFKNFFTSVSLLLRSEPGSRKEIEIKSKVNKLFNLLRNKKKLNEDFNIINGFIQRLMKLKETAEASR